MRSGIAHSYLPGHAVGVLGHKDDREVPQVLGYGDGQGREGVKGDRDLGDRGGMKTWQCMGMPWLKVQLGTQLHVHTKACKCKQTNNTIIN